MNEITIFSPATVANVSCGFDVLGFCLDGIGDTMVIRKTKRKGIYIKKISGFDVPYETELNVSGVAALAMYNSIDIDFGFEIEIDKKIKPGSGLGSSAASAVGSVFGMNELLGKPFNKTALTAFALKGEALASQSEHADNLAPALFGGFTLVKSMAPLEILEIPSPANLYATILHPHIEIKTSDARAILPKEIALSVAIKQGANLGSLIHALHTSDYELIKRALHDFIVEPYRSKLIPKFDEVKKEAIKSGALGTGISGSGPSIFSLSKGYPNTIHVKEAMEYVYTNIGVAFDLYISKINKEGIKILNIQ